MFKFQIITLFPDYFKSPLEQGLLNQALSKKILQIDCINPRDFSTSPTKRVDDEPFGGGGGMILSYEPLEKSLQSLKEKGHVIYLSPKGALWTAKKAKSLARQQKTLTLVCGRYEGIDERFIQDFVDEEISVGDYVLNGGEVAGLALIESLSRFIPGFLGNKKSSQKESFEQGFLLESPQWTRPRKIGNHQIPEVILSGHHERIKKLRHYISLVLTSLRRPDLFLKSPYSKELSLAQKELQKLTDKELESLGFSREDLKANS